MSRRYARILVAGSAAVVAATMAQAASAGHTRSPGSDTPNSFGDTHASSGISKG